MGIKTYLYFFRLLKTYVKVPVLHLFLKVEHLYIIIIE